MPIRDWTQAVWSSNNAYCLDTLADHFVVVDQTGERELRLRLVTTAGQVASETRLTVPRDKGLTVR
jgi:hypothetical protein